MRSINPDCPVYFTMQTITCLWTADVHLAFAAFHRLLVVLFGQTAAVPIDGRVVLLARDNSVDPYCCCDSATLFEALRNLVNTSE